MDENKCYFEKGQYYFGHDDFSKKVIPSESLISVDNYVYAALSDAPEAGLVFVQRDNKYGVFTMHSCGQGGYGGMTFVSNIFPFIYDEVLVNGDFCGNGVGYVAVRINHSWGILRVQDHMVEGNLKAHRPCMMIVPCIYPSQEIAISFIDKKFYNPRLGWRKPFEEADGHTLR